jgi:hypothetical protein
MCVSLLNVILPFSATNWRFLTSSGRTYLQPTRTDFVKRLRYNVMM